MSFYEYYCVKLPDLTGEKNPYLFKQNVIGLEFTVPHLLKFCDLGNIDHHEVDDTAETPSACEQALSCDIPPKGSIFVTVYPDADAITAMAVLTSRQQGREIDTTIIKLVSDYDKYGPAAGDPADILIAISRVSGNQDIPLSERVEWIQGALAGKRDYDLIQRLIGDHHEKYQQALESSEVTVVSGGRIAVVVSSHRYATRIGYKHAQILVCMNTKTPLDFKNSEKGSYMKFTVCRYNSYVKCDLPAVLVELQAIEPGWGGRADIIGSPIGVSSKLSLDEVLKIVESHLKT